MSCGSGEARRVGRRVCSILIVFPSFSVRLSGPAVSGL